MSDSPIIRRRHQRADIDGTRFLFLATLRNYGTAEEPVYVEHNEVMRVIETRRTARLAKVGVLEGELQAAALRFAGVITEGEA